MPAGDPLARYALPWRGIASIWLFSALPFLRLIASNPNTDLHFARLGGLWLLAGTLLTVPVLVWWFGGRRDARRLATATGLLMFVFSHLAVSIRDALGLEPVLGVDGALSIAVGLGVLIVLVTRWDWTRSFGLVLAGLVGLVPVIQIVLPPDQVAEVSLGVGARIEAAAPKETPNVYWFVLDGYGRADVLGDVYAMKEAGDFVEALRSRGIQVSDKAVAAYPMTDLSVGSTLAMEYVASTGDSVHDLSDMRRLIAGDNPVVETLRAWGYTYVHWDSVWNGARCESDVEVCVSVYERGATEIEWVLLSMTAIGEQIAPHLLARRYAALSDPLIALGAIRQESPREPFFSLIHLVNPHPPHFTLGVECELRVAAFNLRAAYVPADYLDAVRCVNGRMLEALEEISANDPTAIVVMQGDHGPGVLSIADSRFDQWDDRSIRIRYGVLSAMRLPEGCVVPDDLNLVNTFRVVIDCLSPTDVPLLPSRVFLANRFPGEVLEVDVPE